MEWLFSLFTGKLGGYLVSAGVGAVMAASVASYITAAIYRAPLAEAHTATATVQSQFDAYKAEVAQKAAQATAVALAQRQADDAKANDLQVQLAKSQKDADAKSAKLRAILDKAAPQDVRPLGPTAAAYFDGLHKLQTSAIAAPGN